MAALIREVITQYKPDLPLETILDEREAILAACARAEPRDLVVAFIDNVQEDIDLVRNYAAQAAVVSGLACTLGPEPGPARGQGPARGCALAAAPLSGAGHPARQGGCHRRAPRAGRRGAHP